MLFSDEFVKAEHQHRMEQLRRSRPKTKRPDRQSHTVIAGKERKRLRAKESWAV